MSKLTSKERGKIPGDKFAGPNRSYPIEDKGHARAAIVDSSRAAAAGDLSRELEERIKSKADRVLKSAPKRRGILGKKADDEGDHEYR